jgi:hypothetical protein
VGKQDDALSSTTKRFLVINDASVRPSNVSTARLRTIHALRNQPPRRQIVGGRLEHLESGLAAQLMAQSILTQSILRLLPIAAAGWRVTAVNVTGGTQSGPQQSRKRKNTKAAEKKYDGECNNIGVFKRPNQNGAPADKESSEHQYLRRSPSPWVVFRHKFDWSKL